MGMGRLGLASRSRLARLGSALIYVSVGASTVAGQPSLGRLRGPGNAYTI